MSEQLPVNEIPTYLLQVSKQTAMTGEVVTISSNLPRNSTAEELKQEMSKIAAAIDHRMEEVNKIVLQATKGKFGIHDYDISMSTGIPLDEVAGDGRDN